ncbi:MAG: hypothetical protein ACFFAS_13300 [Promethearchaeota archaeon]
MLITTEEIKLINFLHEIEDITDLNGCFFVNVENYSVIESTIPFFIPEEILWELSVLRDTFQQFASGFGHKALQELTIEGDRGYIMFYNVPPHLVLLAMGAYDINLSYVKLAMIDILKNIRKEIFKLGDEVLKIPPKGFGKIGIELETEPKKPAVSKIIAPEPVSEPTALELVVPQKEELKVNDDQPVEMITESIQTQSSVSTEEITSKASTEVKEPEEMGLFELIDSVKDQKIDEKYILLKKIFSQLKEKFPSFTGVHFSKALNKIKDIVLEHIGTSLALFDISRCSRDLNKNNNQLTPKDIKRYSDRIDNWASRIIK